MTAAAVPNFGKQLWIAKHGESLVKVAELISLKQPPKARTTIDVTTHDSPTDAHGGVPMEKIKEPVYDPGQLSGSMHYVAGSDADTIWLEALHSPDLYDVKVVVPNGTNAPEAETFTGYVIGYDPQDAPVRGVQVANFTVDISGVITQAAS